MSEDEVTGIAGGRMRCPNCGGEETIILPPSSRDNYLGKEIVCSRGHKLRIIAKRDVPARLEIDAEVIFD